MGNYVFLIGNGINNINTTYTWYDLIEDLIKYIGAKGQINTVNKPFPLLYEEIVANAIRKKNISETDIKQFIAGQITKLQPNEIHRRIIASGIQHILTTNYDFTLEQLLTPQTEQLKNEGAVKENLYSIFRHNQLKDKFIWHIHGDRNHLSSITLGYEHYSGYLQQMRNYVATGASYKNLKLEPLIRRKNTGDEAIIHSWLDFFFRKDIYIIGLTLDFIEIHLWWLLTYRQRAIQSGKLKVNNTITYFYPDYLESNIQHKIQLLNAYQVKTKSMTYDEKNGADYYLRIFDKIEKNGIR